MEYFLFLALSIIYLSLFNIFLWNRYFKENNITPLSINLKLAFIDLFVMEALTLSIEHPRNITIKYCTECFLTYFYPFCSLVGEFKLNIECNHATLSGHRFVL